MADMNNLDKLTDKIYQEGIERAENESTRILSKAEAERIRILDGAKQQAKKITDHATSEANKLTRSVEKELQLKGKQLVSDLKGEIQNLLSRKILKAPTKEAFSDVAFIQEAILKAIDSWAPTDDLELLLPTELENKLEKNFQQSIRDYSKNLTVTFNDQLQGGFKISERSDSYQISFTDEDFIHLFNSYLEEQTTNILFTTAT